MHVHLSKHIYIITFVSKILGHLKYFLVIEVARNSQGLFLSQRKYALEIIDECGLLGAKPVDFPMEANHKLTLTSGKPLDDLTSYRKLVGRLIYLTITRSKLSYFVHILSQLMQNCKENQMVVAKWVLRNLKGNPWQGLLIRRDSDLLLVVFSDSNWEACNIPNS